MEIIERGYLIMKNYADYVNTNIGTYGHLLTACSPAVQSPHGAAVISPAFAPGVKDFYTSDKIYGFKTGGTIIMPTCNKTAIDIEQDGACFYETASRFDHDLETAKPHYYNVLLEDYDIKESHTAFQNYGVYTFDFGNNKECYIMLYGKSGTEYKIEGNRIYITGFVPRNATGYTLFVFDEILETSVKKIKAPNEYKSEEMEDTVAVCVKVSSGNQTVLFTTSVISFDYCDKTYTKFLEGKTFTDVKEKCEQAWNNVLSKIDVVGMNEDMKTVFYTSFYRSVSRMHNYSENGHYIGFDGNIHENEGHEYYCDDGIWDTYRCAHPLQLIVEPKIHEDIVASYLRMYQQSGWLPRFPYIKGNVPCMLGHHTVSLLADSLAKGVSFDVALGYEAAYKNATKRTMLPWKDGEADELTQCYYDKGFFPGREEDEEEWFDGVHEFEDRQAAAVTMEHSYDDWCMAQIARYLNKREEEEYFLKRSKNYKNVINPETGFAHPRNANGEFVKNYNPKLCGGQGGRKYFAENNAYIYTFNIQHDVEGMVEAIGGKEKFIEKLDNLFIEQYEVPKYYFLKQYPDATGLMGQYCHGNEPSFHIPYLYNYVGEAYKTQRKVREIIKLWYTNHPLGICGDEDGGAMCSWLVFSAIGFYPVCPGSSEYALGSPIFDKVTVTLGNGKTFTITAKGASEGLKYIQSATLNGKPHNKAFFDHKDLAEGGELVLIMGDRPNKKFGC